MTKGQLPACHTHSWPEFCPQWCPSLGLNILLSRSWSSEELHFSLDPPLGLCSRSCYYPFPGVHLSEWLGESGLPSSLGFQASSVAKSISSPGGQQRAANRHLRASLLEH